MLYESAKFLACPQGRGNCLWPWLQFQNFAVDTDIVIRLCLLQNRIWTRLSLRHTENVTKLQRYRNNHCEFFVFCFFFTREVVLNRFLDAPTTNWTPRHPVGSLISIRFILCEVRRLTKGVWPWPDLCSLTIFYHPVSLFSSFSFFCPFASSLVASAQTRQTIVESFGKNVIVTMNFLKKKKDLLQL